MNQCIFISGASGFLGSAVERIFFTNGYSVFPVESLRKFDDTKSWFNYLEAELNEREPVAFINVGASQNGGDDILAVNELTMANVVCPAATASLLAKAKYKTQFITIATSWQYGSRGEYCPFNLYAASKQALNNYLEHFAKDGLKCTSLILFDTYSQEDKRRKIHRLIAESISKREALNMTEGEQVINLVHIDDAANGVYQAFVNRSNEVTNITALICWAIKSKENWKVKELISLINEEDVMLFNLGGREYRNREIFEIFNGYEAVPGWESIRNNREELSRLFLSARA